MTTETPKIAQEPWRSILMCAQGLSGIAVTLAVISGYRHVVEKQPTYSWPEDALWGMSWPTAISIICLGVALFATIEYLKRSAKLGVYR